MGGSALEQLDSEPAPPEPGAAKLLFGAAGASLGDEEPIEIAQEPVELDSPEDVLKPLGVADESPPPDDDPDLLAPVEEAAPPPARHAQPLAHLVAPMVVGALAVAGEHRVAVHTRGGRTRRGSIKDIDLSKSQFALIPQGGEEPESVYHAEVKAIFFMLAPGEKAKRGDGKRVRVTFADGRTIEGHRDGAEGKHGFFLVPGDA
jgi:small nuclear ribonucleoprotein (snRNP)-like protein